ncbi:MAG TPA: replication-associated recombination protein A [Bdellovibrionota bacterium]|nr:replication-associated recombination protein A [Bdellovibrionota bacterium]
MEKSAAPLAERMRPRSLSQVLGHPDILGPEGTLTRLIDNASQNPAALPSLVFWGPPGCGKTTIAKIIAEQLGLPFKMVSAINTSSADARKILGEAEFRFENRNERSLLFVDEIHRFNKNQQDVYLHALESGAVILLGATTENPSFELNAALLSRARVIVLNAVPDEEVLTLLREALVDQEKGLGQSPEKISEEALAWIANSAGGDVRSALSMLESAVASAPKQMETVDLAAAKKYALRSSIKHDKAGESHYNVISALHKSIRNSDPDASLLWLARLIVGGEDPKFIARRLLRAAYEDIGLADPQACVQAQVCVEAVNFLGYPECDVALAQATVYLACAPKSNAVYNAIGEAKRYAESHPGLSVPLRLRNAPTKLMKNEGYGKEYQYDHDFKHHVGPSQSWPDESRRKLFYDPGELGFEKEVQKRLLFFKELRGKPQDS